ncbi:AFR350Wp [Eremothecium gossypii ATCC 10895]|uniref:AFR350Wp n=1 Tax=Eremothecium gossypii (strain ATCC 10895 / CBS 109.51 / FGSC 9923 / NRRL Y-1056) TaxID=284811 RepID=Q753G2_EREGS|nr:AFR350Wp [Eremothecium gossypii ATCC 10895]AAS53721.2 AFR350Wp [Eremothecium gossypii ATCC 10895]AEY98034.1 FAFR350Wp [Eremothecium gossypii FDAG1]
MRLTAILWLVPIVTSIIAFPAKQSNTATDAMINDAVWDEMIRWQSVWLASEDFHSMGIDNELLSQVNGFLRFSESFLKKAYKEKQLEPLHLFNTKDKIRYKFKNNVNRWTEKLLDLMAIRRSIGEQERDKTLNAHGLIDDLHKLRSIVASYIEQSNEVPVVTLLRIVGANIEHQLAELQKALEDLEENGEEQGPGLHSLALQSEGVVRIAELLIETVDEIKATSVDAFLQKNIGDVDTYLGALNDVKYMDSMAIIGEVQKSQDALDDYSLNEFFLRNVRHLHKFKKVFGWFNNTTIVPTDFYAKHSNRRMALLTVKLISYLAYQTIGGTMYCLLELAVPKSNSAWDNCGNFHSAQLRKEWILLSLILTRITSNPLKHHRTGSV